MVKYVELGEDDTASGYAGSARVECPFCEQKLDLSNYHQKCISCGAEYTVAIRFEKPSDDE